jgi:hypothetical protein
MIKREREFESTAGEAFCGSASIPEPILVPITRATAPAMVPFFLATLAGSSLDCTKNFFVFLAEVFLVNSELCSCGWWQKQVQ